MNKLKALGIVTVIACILLVVQLFIHNTEEQMTAYTADEFVIPHDCKHIALLGCTPHPTQYLVDHDNNKELLRNLQIEDFLDIAYVTDSFVRTFEICKKEQIDHLIIAYLPIYFVRMRPILGDTFVGDCRMFLNNIVPEVSKLIIEAIQQTGYQGKATLIAPSDYQLARVPESVNTTDDRIRYLIKQFPKLKNISQSELSTITIINNEDSQEDDMLIAYLKYEYLFEKPIEYTTRSTEKKQFHKPK